MAITKGWPSHNDLGGSGKGIRIYEEALAEAIYNSMGGRNGIVSGCAVTNPSGLTVRVASGTVIINGIAVDFDANIDITATDDATSYQYLHLTRTSGLVTGIEGISQATLVTNTGDYLLIAWSTASSGSITSFNKQPSGSPGVICGRYSGNDTDDRLINLGKTPSKVELHIEKTGYQGVVHSTIESPANFRAMNSRNVQSTLIFSEGVIVHNTVKVLTGSEVVSGDKYPTPSSPYTTTISVTGALVGDVVHVWTDASLSLYGKYYNVYGYCGTAGTITVVIGATANSTIPDGTTIYVKVLTALQIDLHCQIAANPANTLVPKITEGGFTVSYVSGSTAGLNDAGVHYNYIAYFG